MKNKYQLSLTLFLAFAASSAFAQLPEEIQWKHLKKDYTADSSDLMLSLNGKRLQGKYKIPLDEKSFALYTIENGMITGEAFWYTNGGHMECKLHYKRGVRNGLKENYDNEGKAWLRQDYKDGRLNGTSEMYSNGKLSSKSTYLAGKKHGFSTSYSGDKVIAETQYQNDQRNGVSKTYINGQLVTENNYQDDVQHGLSTSYMMGKKTMDATYVNGKRHGISHMYKPDGSVIFESYFLLGEKVSKAAFEKYEAEKGQEHSKKTKP